jgi:phosphoribosylformimino-5-aminoimidazole carboxamide ribotide isomerase
MLIPSIDLMDGRIVQLVQGERKALEFSDFEYWIERFARFPLVQLIDLDAAMNHGSNRDLLFQFTRRLPCQVGGGIRTVEIAREVLGAGALKVIVGSALFKSAQIDAAFAKTLKHSIGREHIVAAVDSKGGRVAVQGWKESSPLTASDAMRQLEPYCGGFLYTHVDTEGMMQGIPMDIVRHLRAATELPLTVAGGITTQQEIDDLHGMGVDAVVGMAIYTGRLQLNPTTRDR